MSDMSLPRGSDAAFLDRCGRDLKTLYVVAPPLLLLVILLIWLLP